MRKLFLTTALFAIIGLTQSFSQETKLKEVKKEMSKTEKTISFGVRGNCNMCKATIEKAVTGVKGVSAANWDKVKKKIDVTYKESKTNEIAIHNAIAAAGYDTEKVMGNKTAYNQLPGCCKYDHTMKMNQTTEVKSDDHSGHNR
jgi:copper chaperone CopZ